jgi:hypothetical protein
MMSHREQWQQAHGHLAAQPKPNGNSLTSIAEPARFGAARHLSVEKLAEQFPADDPVVEDLTIASEEGRLASALNDWIRVSQESADPLLEMLSRAHAAYVVGTFDDAGARYGALTQRFPSSRYFWQCFGHCLRHLGQIDIGTCILTNLGRLSAEAQSQDPDVETALAQRADHATKILALAVAG